MTLYKPSAQQFCWGEWQLLCPTANLWDEKQSLWFFLDNLILVVVATLGQLGTDFRDTRNYIHIMTQIWWVIPIVTGS